MKKHVFVFLMFIFLLITPYLNAEGSHIYLNGGILTNTAYFLDPYMITIGSIFDISLNDSISISPELNVITDKLNFESFWFEGAMLANLNFDGFFVGGGLTKWFLISKDFDHTVQTDFALKLNSGFKSKNLILKFYLITNFDDLFNNIIIGAVVGIGF